MAMCLWLTGRAESGKSTIGRAVASELDRAGLAVALLDEAEMSHLVGGLEATVWLVRLLTESGVTTVVAADRPDRDDRERVREAVADFVEVFVDGGASGAGAESYEEPFAPELRVPTHDRDHDASIALVISWLEHTGVLTRQ